MGPTSPGDATGFFRPSRTKLPPATPPRMGGCTRQPPAPPPPQPSQKGTPARRVGDIVPCRAAMNRHGPTPGDTGPPPPLTQEGPPSSPGQGATPPPHRANAALQPLPPPAAALGPARSPTRRPTHYRDPGLGAPVPSPARPPGVPPAGPVPVRFGREGTVWLSPRLDQDSPPWMVLGGIGPRRAGCGPDRRP